MQQIRQFDYLFVLVGYAMLVYGIFLTGRTVALGLGIGGFALLILGGIVATSRAHKLSDKEAILLLMGLVAILATAIYTCIPLVSNHVHLSVLGIGNFGIALVVLSLYAMCREKS